jgi:precorrin-6B methylase 2
MYVALGVIAKIKLHLKLALYHIYLIWQSVLDAARESFYERSLGIETCGYDTPGKSLTFFGDEFAYGAVDYTQIKKIIAFLQLNENDIFIDIGCGKGRVILYAATQKIKKVIGIEYEKGLADIARRNINSCKALKTEIEVIQADAAVYTITEGTVFFINNPFGYKTLLKVLDNIKKSILAYPRKVRIVYNGSQYQVLLEMSGWLEPEGKINGTGFSIWHNV